MLTSPEKSARIAFHFIQTMVENTYGKSVSYLMGGFFAFTSVFISAVLWAIVFPLAISFVISQFPIVLQALNSVMQLPVLGPVLSILKEVFMAVGTVTFNYISTQILGSISYSIGMTVSNTALLLGCGIAYLLAPVSVILTNLTDRFSNWWALSGESTEDLIWAEVSKYQTTFTFHNFSSEDSTPKYDSAHHKTQYDNSKKDTLGSSGVPMTTPPRLKSSTGHSPTPGVDATVDAKKKAAEAVIYDSAQTNAAQARATDDALGPQLQQQLPSTPPTKLGDYSATNPSVELL